MAKRKQVKRSKPQTPAPAATAPETPASASVSPLRKAWDSWLKLVLTAVGFAAVMLTAYFLVQNDVIPKDLLAPILICGLFLIPLLDMIQRFLEYDKPRKTTLVLGIAYALLLTLAALAPVIQPMFSEAVFQTSLAEKGVEVDLPALGDGQQQWILDINTELIKDEPYTAPYTLWIGDKENHELLKGRMERKSGVHVRGPKEGQKDLFDDHRVRHRFQLDLSGAAQVRLRRFDSELTAPLQLKFYPQFGDMGYLLMLILPLLLMGALLDLADGIKEKFAHYSTRAGFMLSLSWIYANTSAPGDIQGPVIISLFCGMSGALVIGYLLPRLLRPVARKVGIGA